MKPNFTLQPFDLIFDCFTLSGCKSKLAIKHLFFSGWFNIPESLNLATAFIYKNKAAKMPNSLRFDVAKLWD